MIAVLLFLQSQPNEFQRRQHLTFKHPKCGVKSIEKRIPLHLVWDDLELKVGSG